MKSLFFQIRSSYEKNWPEVHAALTGPATRFIYARRPKLPDDVIPVFCYHDLDHASFESDLEFLAENNYQTIDAQILIDHLNGDKKAPHVPLFCQLMMAREVCLRSECRCYKNTQ